MKESISGIEKTELRGMRKIVQTEIDRLKTQRHQRLNQRRSAAIAGTYPSYIRLFLNACIKSAEKNKKRSGY